MLEWGVVKGKGKYKIDLPQLSEEEEEVIEEVSERFKEFSKGKEIGDEKEGRVHIRDLLVEYCHGRRIKLDESQEKYLEEYVFLNVLGLHGIDYLLEDDGIEEIGVIGIQKPIYVYHAKKGWMETNLIFKTEEAAIDIINKMARTLGRRVTFQNPKLNAILQDGSRLHASIPPISGIELTIRKFRKKPITIGDLINYNTFSVDALTFLSFIFQSDYSVIISGNTASGKTSSLNALFSYVPLNDRILLIEETPEINIPHQHKVKMLANEELGIDMRSLVEDTLRMRPDRVIVGEVRTPGEVSALIETILSGQARGAYATFHAQSSEEVVKRLISLGILKVDIASVDFIVMQRRMMRYDIKTKRYWEERRGTEIVEILPGEEPKPNTLFNYDIRKDKMIGSINRSKKIEEIADLFSLTRKELNKEFLKRRKMLAEMSKKKIGFDQSVKLIQKSMFGIS